MPLYNYQCEKCGHVMEMSKKISERDETSADTCSSCDSVGTFKRQVGAPLVAYSVTVNGGYGTVSDGWRDVLRKVHKAPGSRLNETSSHSF